ncbi:hypothetical protein [Edaphosphingomonas haloaromaticamans]|uniref:hypothetical protein n=1 Tax=Edaphosphingomonas haloaromaticamans TaxID=653954 RepID=UPI0020C7F800|nr:MULTISPECIES: hypothetical protein [Sphingomonas]
MTIGYVFAAEESFVAAPGGDQIAQDAIAELEATFTTGPTLTAVRLPAGSHETLRGLADPGSAGGGNHN